MDPATVLGLLLGALMLCMGMGYDFAHHVFLPSRLACFWDLPSACITLGGTLLGSMLMAQHLRNWRAALAGARTCFRGEAGAPARLVEEIVGLAETARRDGILSLDAVARKTGDLYLARGIRLAVDGTEPELIQAVMRTELEAIEQRHAAVVNFWRGVGHYAPVWGLIGTLIGLVLMLGDMRPENIGPNLAMALLTTFYGVILANLVALPLAEKLRSRHLDEMLLKQIILSGVMAIQSGDNPRIVRQKLVVHLPPAQRPAEVQP